MKFFTQTFFILLVAPILAAATTDAAGSWKVVPVAGFIHKTIAQATFEFRVEGNHLTGTAFVGNVGYPGSAPISQGTIDGSRVSFTVVGEHASSNGIPIMKFAGTVRGNRLELIMDLSDGYGTTTTQMKGEKISK